jgi:nucleoside-diphosphate-sugar epimerase
MIERLLRGMPGVPRIGFNLVDVRDVTDLQIRAMTAPEAAGERFIAAESFQWMEEVTEMLRDDLGETAAKVPRRAVPNLLVRTMALFDPSIRSIVGQLSRNGDLQREGQDSPRLVPSRHQRDDHGLRPEPCSTRVSSSGRRSIRSRIDCLVLACGSILCTSEGRA